MQTDLNNICIDRGYWIISGVIVIALLVLEYYLFNEYVSKYISVGYPYGYDQAVYLSRSYQLYDNIQKYGAIKSIINEILRPKPNGSLLEINAAILFYVFSPSRFYALLANYIFFAIFQVMFVYVVNTLTNNWRLSVLGLGVILSLNLPFRPYGGIYDFRIDFISFCLYGIFVLLCLMTRSFSDRKWSIVMGLVASLLIAFRHNTIVYICGAYFGMLLIIIATNKSVWGTSKYKSIINNYIISLVTFIVAIMPLLVISGKVIYKYYASQQTTRASVRILEAGISNIVDSIIYYPKYLIGAQLGLLSVAMLIIFALVLNYNKVIKHNAYTENNNYNCGPDNISNVSNVLNVAICISVPLIVLTINPAKSPIVGGIVVIPIIILWLMVISRYNYRSSIIKGMGLLSSIAILAIIIGSINQVINYTKTKNLSAADEAKLRQYYKVIGDYSLQSNIKSPKILVDCLANDYMSPYAMNVVYYENYHQYILPLQPFLVNQVYSSSANYIINNLSDIDIITITHSFDNNNDIYPYCKTMYSIQPSLLSYVSSNYHIIYSGVMFGKYISAYVKNSK